MRYVKRYPKLFLLISGFCFAFTCFLVIQSSRRFDMFTSYNYQADKQNVLSSKQDKVTVRYLPEPYIKHVDKGVFYNNATNEEFWDDRPLTMYEAIAQHQRNALETCDNRCNEFGCRITKLADWNWLAYHSQVPYKPFLARGQYVFPWERTYLSRPPLEDSRSLPDLTLSKVTVEGVTSGVVLCNISDTVHGRVDLVDGYGNLRTSGDDEVRVWITSVEQVGFAASGNVTDLKNGSYLFTFRCLLPGMSTSTLCWTTPNIPGRPCVCNMTHNGQETYYCGRPKDSRLNCDDWQTTEKLLTPTQPYNVTKAEMAMIKNSTGTANSTLIDHKIKIFTNSGALPGLLPCHQMTPRPTWGITMPKGYWSPGLVWNSLLCQEPRNITTEWTLNCLRNTTVWIFGDSNAHRSYRSLLDLTKCKDVVGDWPNTSFCSIPEIGLNITCRSHENPRYARIPRNSTVAPISAVLGTVPESGRHIVVIHYYLHYTPSHLGVLYLRMTTLRGVVEKLLQRNEHIVIGIRGPHIATKDWDYNHSIGGDPLGPRYVDIIKSVFRGLEDRVIYLDTWDMTIGIENEAFHPPYELTREMFKNMLSFLCQ